ncbi:MAG: hypothetical protein AAF490_03175 [Chloroflexota bacterium]
MDIFKKRLPERQQLIYVFLAFAFVSNAWALYDISQEFSAFVLRLSLGELLGVYSHSLMFALVDAMFAFMLFLIASFILPTAWVRERFVSIGTSIAFITGVWMIIFHLNNLASRRNVTSIGLWLGSYILVLIAVYIFIHRNEKFHQGIANFIERLALLAGIYIFLDIVGFLVIIIRNIGGVA